jgi:hypothetical protein
MARTRFTGRNGSLKQDLEALERWAPTTKRAVIVGGGLIELAEMLRFPISLSFLVREKSFGMEFYFWRKPNDVIFWNIILI